MRRADLGLRVDYIHQDLAASLGKSVLYRAPVAFLRERDRAGEDSLEKYLPPALPLGSVLPALGDP